MTIDEDLLPQRVIVQVDLLLRLEQSLTWHLLLAACLASLNDSFSSVVDSFDDAFKPLHEVKPVCFGDCTSNFVPARVVGQLEIHVSQVIRLMLLVEFLA